MTEEQALEYLHNFASNGGAYRHSEHLDVEQAYGVLNEMIARIRELEK